MLTFSRPRPRWTAILCATAALVLTSCTSSSTPDRPAPRNGPSVRQVTEAQNGAEVRLAAGDTLVVVLHSTYWGTTTTASPPTILLRTALVTTPAPHPNFPGSGQGTVVARFRALGPGVAQVTAFRTTCGEAMRCTAHQGQFRLSVRVH